ncbi:MAG TPA: hypothetical protein VM487_03560 [Phycisphaerae bacterium]|nr:hypothetical protein [Phycisphaerae bacterium]
MKLKGLAAIGTALALAVGVLSPGRASAADIYYVPNAGGNWSTAANWSLGRRPIANDDVRIEVSGNAHKAVLYDWSGTSGFNSLKIDGDGSFYGALWHLDNSILTDYMYLGDDGEAWEWMEGDAFLWVLENLYVGYRDPGPGHFYLNVQTYGVAVNGITYVGYSGPGDFDHYNGYHQCGFLFVGQNAPARYWLKGPEDTSTLTVVNYAVIGNGGVGLFEQTGGTFDQQGSAGLQIGLNSGGSGTYNMKGGALNADHISIGWNSDGFFNHTNGLVEVANNVVIGCQGTHPSRAWYKISDDDGDPELYIAGDLLVGPQTLAKFEQNSGGTVEVAGNLEIWDGSADPYQSSFFYMGVNADWFSAANVINHTGYYDQDGGEMVSQSFTNDSSQGVNLDNNADCQARYFTHNAGPLYMWRNAILRGPYAGGGVYYLCNLTNNSTVQMGDASFNGGTFFGILTNYGSFNYAQGDFSESTLVNHGTFTMNGDFSCMQLVNHANVTVPSDLWILATGDNAPNAVENNGNLSMSPRSHIDVGNDSKLVNNGPMYAGGPGSDYAHIYGDVENNDYLLPSYSSLPSGHLYINGDFTASSSAELRIRIHGTTLDDYDRLSVQGTANLAGELDVRLTNGFVPNAGDTFDIVGYSARTGQFNPVYLPALPDGLEWQMTYQTLRVRLTVVESQTCPGDLDGDNDTDHSDLGILLADWGCVGSEPGDCPGDLDGDNDTDHSDLGILLADWGCGT